MYSYICVSINNLFRALHNVDLYTRHIISLAVVIWKAEAR